MVKKIILSIMFVICIYIPKTYAVCRTDMLKSFVQMLTKVNWHCMFPVRIAGIKIDPFKEKDTVDRDTTLNVLNNNLANYQGSDYSNSGTQVTNADHTDRKIFCQCRSGGISSTIIGIRVGFWEAAKIIEVTKDSWCFPVLGLDLGGGVKVNSSATNDIHNTDDVSYRQRLKKNGSVRQRDDGIKETFWQVHFYTYPVLAILDLMTDFPCLEQSPLDLAYITEPDPRWDDSYLSALLNPDALLFANPIAVLGCIPDVVAATTKSTIDSLYWCMGQWGTVYPLSGHITGQGHLQTMAAAMGKTMYQLHRSFSLMGTVGKRALCSTYLMPIWKKSQYRWQLMTPKKDSGCRVIGEPAPLWESMKNPLSPKKNIDNFAIMLWRKRTCCAR